MTFLSSFRVLPLDQSLLVVPTLRPYFVANVMTGLCDSLKIVVTFFLLRLHTLHCYDLHRSTSLLSFSDVTVRLLLYLILQLLVFADVIIGLPCWSYSWRNILINCVL